MELSLPVARSLNGLTSNAEAARFPIHNCALVISSEVEKSFLIKIETKRLALIPHDPKHLLALLTSSEESEKISGMRIAEGVREFLLSASPQFFAQLQTASEPDLWKIGLAIIHRIDVVMIGMCGFAAPPDSDGTVEIGYGIAPDYQGKGYASEAAQGLVDFASRDPRVRTIRAHTLLQASASTRVLEKCGFEKISETVDPENNMPIWRWERSGKSTSTS
jgi:[ribosomal protein S5]-alanine N-acetyltransferase